MMVLSQYNHTDQKLMWGKGSPSKTARAVVAMRSCMTVWRSTQRTSAGTDEYRSPLPQAWGSCDRGFCSSFFSFSRGTELNFACGTSLRFAAMSSLS